MSGPWGSTPWGSRFGGSTSTTTTEVECGLATAQGTGYSAEVEGSTPFVVPAPWGSTPWGSAQPPVFPYYLIEASASADASGYAAQIEGVTTILGTVGTADGSGYACTVSLDVEFPFGWNQSKRLSVKHDQVTGSHAYFPVYITEANLPSEMWSGVYPAQIDGGDIRFTLEVDESRLPLAIIEWVPGTRAKFLVMVPGVNDATDVQIRVWWNVSSHQRQPAHDEPYGVQAALPAGLTLAAPLVGQHALARLANTDGLIYRLTNPTSPPYNEVWSQKVVNGVSGGKHNGFTNLAKLSDGTLLLGFKEDSSHVSTASGKYRIYASVDGGETWALRSTIDYVTTPIDTQSFMGPLFVAPDDTVYCFGQKFDVSITNYAGTGWMKSTDGGRSWLAFHDIDTKVGLFCHPRASLDGLKAFVPFYEATAVDLGGGSVTFRPWLYIFDLATETFTKVQVTSNWGLYNEWSMEEVSPNRLVGIWRRNSGGTNYPYLYRNESFDGGLTWTYTDATVNWPVSITLTANSPDHPCLRKTHDGKLLLGYSSDRGNGDIRVALSDDYGVSWRSRYAALRGGHDPVDQASSSFGGYVGLVELAPDHIVASWYYESSGLYGNIFVNHIYRHDTAGFNDLEWWNVPELSADSPKWGGRAVKISGSNFLGHYGKTAFKPMHNGGAFSLWMWVTLDEVTSLTDYAFLGSSIMVGGANGIAFSYDNRQGSVSGGGTHALRLTAENTSGITIDATTNDVLTAANTWYMVGARSAGGVGATVHLRVNDTEYTHSSEVAYLGTADSTNNTAIGAIYTPSGQYYVHSGSMAWLWMASVDLGSDWLDTHYSNFNSPETFVEEASDVDIACPIATASGEGYSAFVEGEWFGIPVEIAAVQVGNVASGVFCDVLGGSMLTADDIESIAQAVIAAIFAAAQETPISANMVQSVGVALKGDGTVANKFRSILVP